MSEINLAVMCMQSSLQRRRRNNASTLPVSPTLNAKYQFAGLI
jgi:hypothetical protein